MFASIKFSLEPSNNKPFPAANGHYLHGLLFRRLAEVDSVYVDKLHNSNDAKPFALTPLAIGKGEAWRNSESSHVKGSVTLDNVTITPDQPRNATFRIGVWDVVLEDMIYRAFKAGGVLHVGPAGFIIENVVCTGRLDKAELDKAENDDVLSSFTIRFIQPTAFRSSGRTLLFPETRLVFGSLARVWAQAMGDALPDEILAEISACVFPSQYQLMTKAITMRRFFITGFTGYCRYAVDAGISREAKVVLNKLLRIIYFTGLGYKTTMGLGESEYVRIK